MEREFSVPLWTHLVKPLLSYQGHRHNIKSGGRGGFVRGHESVPQVLHHYQFQYNSPLKIWGGAEAHKAPHAVYTLVYGSLALRGLRTSRFTVSLPCSWVL